MITVRVKGGNKQELLFVLFDDNFKGAAYSAVGANKLTQRAPSAFFQFHRFHRLTHDF
jgi:hypothetical protein